MSSRHLISLGRACDVAFQLRMHGAENIPHFFDWLGGSIESFINIIAADFNVFDAENLTYVTDHTFRHVKDRVLDLAFWHQFPLIDGHTTADYMLFYPTFIKTIQFRARRFREYVTSHSVTLVRRDITQDEALRLEDVFFNRFPNADAQFLYLVHEDDEFQTPHGHARHIPRTSFSLGEPEVWINILTEEGLIARPYLHSTVEILGASHEDHSLSPDDRFNEEQLFGAMLGNPEHPLFPVELARYYRRQGRFDEAFVQAAKSLSIAPDNAEAMFELVSNSLLRGTIDANRAADRLIALSQRSQLGGLLTKIAECLLDADRVVEAADYSARAIKQNHLDDAAFFARAMSWYRQGEVEAAERTISVAIRLNSRNERYHHLHARFLDELNRLDEALLAARRSVSCGGQFDPQVHLGRVLNRMEQTREAIDIWETALPLAGSNRATVQGWIDEATARLAVSA